MSGSSGLSIDAKSGRLSQWTLQPFLAFHRWLTTPSTRLDEVNFELFAMTNYTMTLGLVAHLSFIPLFLWLGSVPLALFNIVSVAIFLFALYLSRRAYFITSLLVGTAEVLVHALLATIIFGLVSFLHMFAILAIQLNLLLTPVTIRVRIVIAALVSGAYLGIIMVGIWRPPFIVLPFPTLVTIVFMSLLITFVVMCGMAIYHTWTVQVTRAARIRAEHDLQIARDEAVAAREDAVEASHAKSNFLASMSHELRTPMNAIIGYSEMLAEDADDQTQRDDLNKILSAGRHLLTLINEILDLSKIEAGRMEVFRKRFELDGFVNNIADTVRPLAEVNGNSLVVEMDGVLGEMYSDETKIRQIVLNLLSNACKFTHSGTVTLEVGCIRTSDPPQIRIAVTDTGIGVSEAALSRIFKEFEQADISTSEEYGGTGLGLALTKAFCELLGGDITASSQPGKGSHFEVTLPLTAPTSIPARRDPQSRHSIASTV